MVVKEWNGVGYRAFYTQDKWIHITDMNGIILCDMTPDEYESLEEALQGYVDFMSSQGQRYLH
ncbi:hypothetical protein ACU5DF_23830 [Aliivibrio wodanis]|uniref:hypothetical protein n=1 Tax=Aliivibrio wodanis TaxID=80852 RepID=UPI00406C5FBD